MNEFLLIILEKVFEAVYFSLFFIFGKNLKKKRLLLIAIMIFEYLLLKNFIKYNIWFQISYTFMSYLTLKILYKQKAQITDIFLFVSASIILMIICFIFALFQILFGVKYSLLLVLNRFFTILFLVLIKNKINYLYKKYYALWNKHNYKDKIKSLTLRNISIVIFNLMFYIINIGLIYILYTNK